MKKTVSALLLLLGAMYYSQSSIFVFNNQNPHYDAVGRFFAGNIVPGNPVSMFAAPNTPYGTYTMPSGIYDKYVTFDTSGLTGSGIMNIDRWYVGDYSNPANSGTYNYYDPYITSLTTNNEWAGFIFWLQDVSSGNTYDYFEVGNPAVAANIGFNVVPYQIGATTGVKADWYTITSGSDQITFFTIYP